MANAPLQQFAKKESPWRFLKMSLKLRAPEPAYSHILITLADHADSSGVCYPGHDRLMDETGYKSKNTIVCALKHWKNAGVLTWKKGWGNNHGSRPNVYQFHEDVMLKLIAAQPSRNSDEQTLGTDECTLRGDEQTLGTDECTLGDDECTPDLPLRSQLGKVPAKTSQLGKERAAPPSDVDTRRQEQSASQTHLGESPIGVHSSEGPLKVHSSPAHTIPPHVEYNHGERCWMARSDLGRGTTKAEIEDIRCLNRERVKPPSIQ